MLNIQPTSLWGKMPIGAIQTDPELGFVFREDFLNPYIDTTNVWSVLNTGSGTVAVADAEGGQLSMLTAASDNDVYLLQHQNEVFLLSAGKQLLFEAKVKIDDPTQSDFFVGLMVSEDIRATADSRPANGIGFTKNDGDAYLDFSSSLGGVDEYEEAIHTVVASTWMRLGFYWDGVDTIVAYVDGVKVATLTESTSRPTGEMAVALMVRNGEGSTTTLTCDWIQVAQER